MTENLNTSLIKAKADVINSLDNLDKNLNNYNDWLEKNSELHSEYNKSVQFENEFNSLIKTKYKLKNLINLIDYKLEMLTLY